MAVPLLYMLKMCMLKMCIKLHNLCMNCSVQMSVICLVLLLLLHTAMHNIGLTKCQDSAYK